MLNENSKVLVVDDSPLMRHIMKLKFMKLFKIPEKNITSAESCHDAISALRTNDYDLIFTDTNFMDANKMPDMSGIQLIAVIRNDETLNKHRNIPVILSSADEFSDDDIRDVGADAFCLKRDMDERLPIAVEQAFTRRPKAPGTARQGPGMEP